MSVECGGSSGKEGEKGDSAGDPEDPITAGWCLSLAHKCWDYMWKEAWDRGAGLPVSGGCWNDKDGGCQTQSPTCCS